MAGAFSMSPVVALKHAVFQLVFFAHSDPAPSPLLAKSTYGLADELEILNKRKHTSVPRTSQPSILT